MSKDTRRGAPLREGTRAEQVFPTLTPAQLSRIAAHGHRRRVDRGEVLIEAGDSDVPFFVVTQGQIEIVRPAGTVETIITVHGPSGGLAESMSRYLIRRIEDNPAIELRTHTEIIGLEGSGGIERVRVRNTRTGSIETSRISHVFVMTGAIPNTGWLDGCLALDANGFIKTGPDISADDLAGAGWPRGRAPHLLETSRPGVFAVGDVRGGNIKRVASAVGEGSIAVAFVHRVLQE